MKKKIAFIIILGTVLITSIILVVVFFLQKDNSNYHKSMPPEPTESRLGQHKEEGNNAERQAFFDAMHKAAPGTNWRKRDADLRFALMQGRAQNYHQRIAGGEWDTLAEGAVIGKWDELGSFNTAGRIWATEVDFDDELIYAFSDGGNLWKGDLDGSNWSVINDHFKIGGAHFLRKVDDRLIVGTSQWGGQGMYFTDNEGLDWTMTTGMENVATWGYVFDVEMLNDATHTIYALALEWDYTNWWDIISLYKSTDLGVSFEKITSWDVPTYGGTNNFVMWSPPYGSANCFLIENNHAYALDAAGIPQTLGDLPLTDEGDIMLCGYENAGNTTLYAAQVSYVDYTTDFFRSTDGGLSWVMTGNVGEGNFSKNSFYCSQKMAGYLYYGGVDTYRSFSGGDTWTRNNYWWEYYDDIESNMHADIPFIRSFINPDTDQEIVLISTDGGLYVTNDYGLIWSNLTNEGMRNAQYYDVYTYRWLTDIMFAGAQDQGYQRSSYDVDGDYYFDQLISGDYGHIVSRSGGDYLWCVYPGFAMYIDDASGGSNLSFWDFQGYGHLWMAPIMADPFEDDIAWWGGGSDAGGAYLWRLDKNPGSIDAVKQPKNFSVAGGGSISAITYSPVDPNHWYLLTSSGNFYHSDDAGVTWDLSSGFNGPDAHYFYGSTIVASEAQSGVVYIGGSGYDNSPVYVSSDHGATFTALDDGLPGTMVYDLAVTEDDSLLFAATEVAPYVCVLAEGKWYNLAEYDAPLQTYWSVDYVKEIHAARFGTYGRGTWEFSLYNEPVSGIPTEAGDLILSVYPNPAAEVVSLSSPVFLPDAIIQVYDMNGKLMLTKHAALNKQIPYSIPVQSLESGSYMIVVQQGQYKFTKHIVCL